VHRATVRQIAGIGVAAAIAASAAYASSPDAVLGAVETLLDRPVLFSVALFGLYLVRPLLAWPISALSVLLGYLLGPEAIPVALFGAVLTTLPAYLLAGWFGHEAGLLGRIGDAGTSIRRTTGDLRGVIAVRLAPLPTDPVSYAAGVAGVPFRPYVLGTAVGEAPWVGAAVLLGASMGRLTTTGGSTSTSPLVLATAIALAVLFAVSRPAYRRLSEGTALRT
jgi:uncharacterized membrane protein YdjX (TVP38/TMEM64 family)